MRLYTVPIQKMKFGMNCGFRSGTGLPFSTRFRDESLIKVSLIPSPLLDHGTRTEV